MYNDAMDDDAPLGSHDTPLTSGTGEDRGPWCLGLPMAGRRVLSDEEKPLLRRVFLRYVTVFTAMILAVPFLTLMAILILPDEAMLVATFACVVECFVLLGVFLSREQPLGKALATFRDCRAGYVERCEGAYESAHSDSEYVSQLATVRGESSALHTIINEMRTRGESTQELERLPYSGRIWTVNGKLTLGWVYVRWEGVATVIVLEKDPFFLYPWDGSFGFVIASISMAVTIVAYHILSVPLICTPLVLAPVWIALTRLFWVWYKRQSME